jgi:hypothetical protein
MGGYEERGNERQEDAKEERKNELRKLHTNF